MSNLEDMILKHEGCKLFPYHCAAGKLTIGVGRNLDDRGITTDEAMTLFRNDVNNCVKDLAKAFPWSAKLDEVRLAVLIDMCFNLGIEGLKKFVKFIGFVSSGDYQTASIEMLASRWASQVGPRATRLSKMMKTGGWSIN